MQPLQQQISPAVQAFGRLIRAQASLTRKLSALLDAEHGLTIAEYEVLLLLSRAPEQSMRRVDLAVEVRLSPSGVTRMLDRLQDAGLVEKGFCASDARVTYAVLTEPGRAKLDEISPGHEAEIERLLGESLDEDELATLAGLLARIPGGDGADGCSAPITPGD